MCSYLFTSSHPAKLYSDQQFGTPLVDVINADTGKSLNISPAKLKQIHLSGSISYTVTGQGECQYFQIHIKHNFTYLV